MLYEVITYLLDLRTVRDREVGELAGALVALRPRTGGGSAID